MITVPEATKTIIERSRYLSEAISKGIINYSSLARYIRPELEQMLVKRVSNASIIMALTRLEKDFQPKYVKSNIFKTKPEIVTHSNLSFFVLSNNEVAGISLLLSREALSRSLYLRNQGIHETTFLISQDLNEKFSSTIESKSPLYKQENVAAITIYIPQESIETAGIYYFFLKSLAWEGINILTVISTFSELTIVVADNDSERAFGVIKSLFA